MPQKLAHRMVGCRRLIQDFKQDKSVPTQARASRAAVRDIKDIKMVGDTGIEPVTPRV